MNRFLFILIAFCLFIFTSCKKNNENIQNENITPFSYKSLIASDTLITIYSIIHIVATATGDELKYKWVSKDLSNNIIGNFIGSGSDVQWNICHASRFTISCEVTDKYNNSETKYVYINCK